METSNPPDAIRRRVYVGILTAALLSGLLSLLFGPYAQDPAYHRFADNRILLHRIPHAGDVLTNFAILAAAAFGWALRPRMAIEPGERAATNLLIGGTALMALGSMYYHWNPTDATLVWDRVPMMLSLMPVLVLVLADRVRLLDARYALWPMTIYAVATVLFWAWSTSRGEGNLWPYGVVRFGAVLLLAYLLVARSALHSAAAWLIWAAVLQIPVSVFENLDRQVWNATGGIVSGHNVKHVVVGLSMAFVFTWMRRRAAIAPATSDQPGGRRLNGPEITRVG